MSLTAYSTKCVLSGHAEASMPLEIVTIRFNSAGPSPLLIAKRCKLSSTLSLSSLVPTETKKMGVFNCFLSLANGATPKLANTPDRACPVGVVERAIAPPSAMAAAPGKELTLACDKSKNATAKTPSVSTKAAL
jgi:hypothetical protein